MPAITLATLLSIDTLKTCVVLDSITYSRHRSNRELIGQGIANILAGSLGGISGAGTMGPTLINVVSGARTQLSGFLFGIFSLLTLLVFGQYIAWVPLSALAGILLVVSARMIDVGSIRLLLSRSTFLDFFVILTVIVIALTVSLIAAIAIGLCLAIMLFLRDQIRGSVIRRLVIGNQTHSKLRHLPSSAILLQEQGNKIVIAELQGSLFLVVWISYIPS
jgi:SulP family sulfate permease